MAYLSLGSSPKVDLTELHGLLQRCLLVHLRGHRHCIDKVGPNSVRSPPSPPPVLVTLCSHPQSYPGKMNRCSSMKPLAALGAVPSTDPAIPPTTPSSLPQQLPRALRLEEA